MEEEERGITFAEIGQVIKRRWLPILLATLLLTALLAAAFLFVFNPHSADYVMTFTISYPGSETFKYPDGSPFYYRDVISAAALTEAKNSDGRFSKVNVDKMVEEDDILLEPLLEEQNGVMIETGKYTLSVSSSYFTNKATATAFLRAVGNVTVKKIHEKAASVNYLIDYEVFDTANYEDRLTLLAEQKNMLLEQYDEWIGYYREGYSVAGKTLRNHRAEVAVAFGTATQEELLSELKTCGYVSAAQIEARASKLREEKAANEAKLAALKQALGEISAPLARTALSSEEVRTSAEQMDLSETIAALIVRNVEIDGELEALTPERVSAFETRIQNEYNKLKEGAETIRAVSVALYDQETRVIFSTSRAEREGGTSLLLVGAGGLVLFFLASVAVACFADLPKVRRREEGPASTEADRE